MPPSQQHAEILAPAGGEAQLRAAVTCGADAVYLGLRGFNARAGAENFAESTLAQTVGWCHARGVRVYVTLNTLITDRELPRWLQSLDAVAAAGADGVIVQDLGLAGVIRRRYPTLPLHASTQMSVHNLAGARQLEQLGFDWVVLARELTAAEIGAICSGTSLQCEVFVHGALCMSVSGQCYLSSMLGERSGNRGRCAQPCRLNFQSHGRSHALSLKDLTLTDRLRELESLGVASFKIEGRLKRPEYVAAAVTACRDSLEGRTPDLETLRSVFSRGGFTDGYYTGRRDLSMFGVRSREDTAATAEVLGRLAALTRNEVGHLPVDMALTLSPHAPASLCVTDGVHRITVTGEIPQKAISRATDEILARRALEKCGGTPFYLQRLECRIAPGLMLPLSALNRLRAAALTALEEARSVVVPYPRSQQTLDEPPGPGPPPRAPPHPQGGPTAALPPLGGSAAYPRRTAGGRPALPASFAACRGTAAAGSLRRPPNGGAAAVLPPAAGGIGGRNAADTQATGPAGGPLRQSGQPTAGPAGRSCRLRRLWPEPHEQRRTEAGRRSRLPGGHPLLRMRPCRRPGAAKPHPLRHPRLRPPAADAAAQLSRQNGGRLRGLLRRQPYH